MKKALFLSLFVSSLVMGNEAVALIKTNGCTSCHNIMGMNKAPAFMGIARKNIRFFGIDAKENIKNSIKHGSSGKYRKFVGTKMPAFDYLSDAQIDSIATWILEEYDKNRANMPQHPHHKHSKW